jgi:hypothetical protein
MTSIIRSTVSATAASLLLFVSCAVLLPASGCASGSRDGDASAADMNAMEKAPFLGAWTSDLDGATLTIEATGIFSIDVPARSNAAAHAVVGRWTCDGDAKTVIFTNLAGAQSCPEVPGTYAVEVVRDTVRFTKSKDACPAREEHMAWGWKKAEAQGASKP